MLRSRDEIPDENIDEPIEFYMSGHFKTGDEVQYLVTLRPAKISSIDYGKTDYPYEIQFETGVKIWVAITDLGAPGEPIKKPRTVDPGLTLGIGVLIGCLLAYLLIGSLNASAQTLVPVRNFRHVAELKYRYIETKKKRPERNANRSTKRQGKQGAKR